MAQGILKYTSPAVVPFRRFIPSIGQVDTATVLVALVIQLVALLVIETIDKGTNFIGSFTSSLLPLTVAAFFELARLSVVIFIVAIVIRIILGLLGRRFGPLSDILADMTEPLMRPIRRILPPLGIVDLSAYIVIVLLIALTMVLRDLQSMFYVSG